MTVRNYIVPFALASAVAASSGTVVVGYPQQLNVGGPNLSQGNFLLSDGLHKLKVGNNIYSAPKDFTLTFNANASGITVTNKTAAAWPAQSVCALQLDLNGASRVSSVPLDSPRIVPIREIVMDLGSPLVAAVAGVAAVQLAGAAGNLTLNGTAVSSGVAYLDVPRNFTLTVATTDQSARTFTVTGKDEYGNTMVETLAGPNNNTVSGKKAFSSISRVAVDGAIATNGVSVGYGTTLGLPLAVRNVTQVLKEAQDAAVATAGTFAFALANAVSTATTADVRGTYIPNAAPDGSKAYRITASIPDPTDIGVAQFAG